MDSRTLTCIALLTALLSGCNEQHSSKRLNCNDDPTELTKTDQQTIRDACALSNKNTQSNDRQW